MVLFELFSNLIPMRKNLPPKFNIRFIEPPCFLNFVSTIDFSHCWRQSFDEGRTHGTGAVTFLTRPVARIESGGCRTPQKWTFWTQKFDFLNLTPSTLLQEPHFWPTLYPKVDLLADWGGGALQPPHPPPPPGYGPVPDVIKLYPSPRFRS